MLPMKPRAHILGICGTAMAGVAALAREAGWRVTGSDAGVYPPMSDWLREQGIAIQPYNPANLEPAPDLCIVGNALSRGNPEVEAMLDRSLPYTSGAQFVGDHVLPGRHAAVVAGTHGKTSTASMLAHVLESAGHKPGFLIGGIPENFGLPARLGEGTPFVLEGDEYDTAFFDKRSKFLHYHARTLVLNNLEFDHADIFPDLAAIQRQFHHLLRTVPASGRIIVNAEDDNLREVLAMGCWTPATTFARHGSAVADWTWEPLAADASRFRLRHRERVVCDVRWPLIGDHMAANACAAAAAAHALGVPHEALEAALQGFAGVRRRMTLAGEARGVRVFDDFAHHPTAIAAVVRAARRQMGDRGRLWVIVEPRSNTMRTRVHESRLPQCFEGADLVIFARPAQASTKPRDDETLDVDAVCAGIGPHALALDDADAIVRHVAPRTRPGDRVLVLSNGGFDNIHQKLLDALAAESAPEPAASQAPSTHSL